MNHHYSVIKMGNSKPIKLLLIHILYLFNQVIKFCEFHLLWVIFSLSLCHCKVLLHQPFSWIIITNIKIYVTFCLQCSHLHNNSSPTTYSQWLSHPNLLERQRHDRVHKEDPTPPRTKILALLDMAQWWKRPQYNSVMVKIRESQLLHLAEEIIHKSVPSVVVCYKMTGRQYWGVGIISDFRLLVVSWHQIKAQSWRTHKSTCWANTQNRDTKPFPFCHLSPKSTIDKTWHSSSWQGNITKMLSSLWKALRRKQYWRVNLYLRGNELVTGTYPTFSFFSTEHTSPMAWFKVQVLYLLWNHSSGPAACPSG